MAQALWMQLWPENNASSVSTSACSPFAKDPSDVDLALQYGRWLLDNSKLEDESFLLNPILTNQLISSPAKHSKRQRMHLFGNRTCSDILDKSSALSMDRSSCPWFLEMSQDVGRYPRTLTQTKCKCPFCYKHDGNQPHRKEARNGLCKGIEIKRKVLRRKTTSDGIPYCDNDVYIYEDTWEDLAVGCTCEYPKTKYARSEL